MTGTGVTVSDPNLDEIAQRAILAVDPEPNGVFGVDLTYDRQGVPNPTEINIGRFFTTHQFFTAAGLNMPYIFAQCALAEGTPSVSPKINPLPAGLAWVRGMDVKPVLTTTTRIEADKESLEARRRTVSA